MHPVARNAKNNALNRRCALRILMHDIAGPDGCPWYDLLGNPLKLVWNISRSNQILARGQVGADGWIEAKLREPPGARDLMLRVGPPCGQPPRQVAETQEPPPSPAEADFDWCVPFELEPQEELRPIHETKGIQARLNRLSYQCGNVDGDHGPITTGALMRFQMANKLDVSGRIDSATQSRLEEELEKLSARA